MLKSVIFAVATYLEWVGCALFQAWDKNGSKVKHSQSFPGRCLFSSSSTAWQKNTFFVNPSPTYIWKGCHPREVTKTSHLGKRNIILKRALWWDMLVPRRVYSVFLCFQMVFEKLQLFKRNTSWFHEKDDMTQRPNTFVPIYQSEEVLGKGKVQQRRCRFFDWGGSWGRWTMFTRKRMLWLKGIQLKGQWWLISP